MKSWTQYPRRILGSLLITVASLSVLAATPSDHTLEAMINDVVRTAEGYLGTPHRLGGMNRRGIDCSGLMYVSFETVGIRLPRTSHEQSELGDRINDRRLQRGDLVFFRRRGRINHVGLVTAIRGNEVEFIHASTSRGVMHSRLSDPYWEDHFAFGRRIWSDPELIRVAPNRPNLAFIPGSYPQTALRKMKRREIKAMSQRQAELMQAEIWARNGYRFRDNEWQQHFDRQFWYQQLPDKTRRRGKVKRRLSDQEKQNLRRLRRIADLDRLR